MGISLGGLGSIGVGSLLNNLTGATSAGMQSQKYAMQSAQVNNLYQKEFAKNAHQWEVEDLKKAGLNPLLSAGGGGASASGGGVASATETASGISPMDLLSAGVGTVNAIHTGKQIQAQTDNIDIDTLYKKAQTQMELLNFAIRKKMSAKEIELIEKQIQETTERINLIKGGKGAQIAGTGVVEGIKNAGKALGDKLTEIF